ncbi:NPL4 family-domain-containing protein [Gaertneriomyces semiglobifer]|nr:NPL4 family-domain-containing protein [Gaertneriomyces semiglobifer]KAI9002434.1 NPL4 family-domain-containing protein [Gaertneriomyces semiglobifer]
MIIRLRSNEGQARIEVNPTDGALVLRQKISTVLKIPDDKFIVSADDAGTKIINANSGTVQSLGLRHGDFLWVALERDSTPANPQQTPNSTSKVAVKQEPIDDMMEKQEGMIKRGRDHRFCKHGDAGMCEYCMPLPPWDASYLEQNKIKHTSFHAYLRQLTDQSKTAAPTSSQFVPPLDEMELKVKTPCPSKGHEPWPKGICTKCQPSAVTLQSQGFRMVDHIEFENAGIIDNFISYWRSSGYQRFGYLYGRYEPYSEVPLGVKAVVSTIYEPPQETGNDSVQLALPDPQEHVVDELARQLGLTKVGMVYTDLTDDGTGKGTVICKRHSDSYFMSSAECILAAQHQLSRPTPSKWSATGRFGSRFVTCVVSGNEDGGIDISSFQVSNTAMAMVRDCIVEASVEPSLMRVKQSTDEQYVPEVFYKYKNKYGLMVQEAAKPTFPVEYLLVTVTHGFPQTPNPTFTSPTRFPIENRGGIETQNPQALQRHLNSGRLTDVLSDFHALLYLIQMGVVEMPDLERAIRIAKSHSEAEANELVHSHSWQTLLMLLKESDHGPGPVTTASGSAAASSASAAGWSCRHCTFHNPGAADSCEICGLPRDQ